MKIWLAVHDTYGICPAMSRGETKRQIEDYICYATGKSNEGRYTVQRFEITPVKRPIAARKKRKAKT